MKIFLLNFFWGVIFLLFEISPIAAQVEKTSYRGWSDCYRLSNKQCEVIIGASCGGRVLLFSLNGKNIIYENQEQDGKSLKNWEQERFDPDAGRFDLGPERATHPIHDLTWMGKWDAEIIDEQTLRLTSVNDTLFGLKNIREFKLHKDSAALAVLQTAINITNKPLTRHFWGRTLVKPRGTLFMPVNPHSRFEHGWGRFLWDPNRIESSSAIDDRIKIQRLIFRFHAVGTTIKGGTDATNGWMVYALDGMVFLKRFEVSTDQDYSGSDHMTGIFYSNGRFCEIEPCGPTYTFAPGDSIEFTERWELKLISPKEIRDDKIFQLIHD